ncbi:MAG: dockerin type I repeat-containing protein [Oscillospiraceae bacterium]|nr:dockerin type I repeat-containing protein [Oscillospiraceae bacterium]
MKKILSLTSAFLMAVSCAGISANAEADFVLLNDGLTFVVTNIDGNNYLMEYYCTNYYQNGVNTDGLAGVLTYYSTSEKFEIGDILIPTGQFSIGESDIQCIGFGENSGFQKIGTCEELGLEVPEISQGTVDLWEKSYLRKSQIHVNPPETMTAKGDATGDGEVNILDVISLNKAVMGKEDLTEEQLQAIDFNQNGKPDADEALTLLKYIVGLIEDFTA